MKFYKENCYFTILMLFFFHRDGILIVPSIYKLRRCGYISHFRNLNSRHKPDNEQYRNAGNTGYAFGHFTGIC